MYKSRSGIPRRSGIERRVFSYDAHVPERRNGVDRRCGLDRRELSGDVDYKGSQDATS